jgi:hypothetical protein
VQNVFPDRRLEPTHGWAKRKPFSGSNRRPIKDMSPMTAAPLNWLLSS